MVTLNALLAASAAILIGVTPPPALGQERLDLRIIQSGHSLTDPIAPILRDFALASGAGPDLVVHLSTIPGSPMDYRWTHAPRLPMPDARTAMGNYDLLVLTERVPLSNTMPWHNSPAEALRWFEHAHNEGAGGAGAETLLYASWVEISSGPDADNPNNDPEGHIAWRTRLPLEFARWIEIGDFVNDNRPDDAKPIRIIPATLVLASAHDAILAGEAPRLTDTSQLFSDDIHVNNFGAYLVALVHFTSIYGLDPRGLPNEAGAISVPEDLASWMQDLAWDIVSTYQIAADRRDLAAERLPIAQFNACIWSDLRHGTGEC